MTTPGEYRQTARVILRNFNGEIFLLHTHFDPEVGLPPRWITPGGGIDAGESPAQAAVRELFEETGLKITEFDLGQSIGELQGIWHWADKINSHSYHDTFFELTVSDFVLDDSSWTADERRDVLEYRWWTTEDLLSTGDLIGPHGLVEFIMNR